MTNLQEKLYRSILRRPLTLEELGRLCGYKTFEEFYDGGYYHDICSGEFWNHTESRTKVPFSKTEVVSLDSEIVSELEERRRKRVYAWVPITISVVALIGAYRQELLWLLQAIMRLLRLR